MGAGASDATHGWAGSRSAADLPHTPPPPRGRAPLVVASVGRVTDSVSARINLQPSVARAVNSLQQSAVSLTAAVFPATRQR